MPKHLTEKEHLSDDELTETEAAQGPLAEVPDDEGLEFLFRRLGKQLQSQWAKLIETYPQGFFHAKRQREEEDDDEKSSSELTAESTTSLESRVEQAEICLPVRAAKSAFFLPHLGIQKTDESRPVIPFISDLLQEIKF